MSRTNPRPDVLPVHVDHIMQPSSASLAFLLLAAACVRSAVPVAPPPAPVPNPPPGVPDASPIEQLTVCVVRNGVLGNVSVSYNPATGDSLYEGRRFRDTFPTDSTFAAGASRYDRNEMPVLNGRRYWSTGLPRAMRPGEIVALHTVQPGKFLEQMGLPGGKYRGLTVFVEPGWTPWRAGVLYLPVRPTCEFQLYQTETSPTMISPPKAPPLPQKAPQLEPLTVCVVRNGVLSNVSASYDPTTGDTLYEGRRFSDAFPADSTFAASAAWYHAHESIIALRRRYVEWGLPRALHPGDLVVRDRYRGVPVYVESQESAVPPALVYLPVRPNCEFQPYETEMGGPVRGE